MIGQNPKEITWWKAADFMEHCRSHSVSPVLRLLLLSNGAVVNLLRALLLEPVTLERIDQKEMILEGEQAQLFRQPEGTQGLLRDVYLVQTARRRIHASSFFPASTLGPRFFHEMVRSESPLGSIIETQGLVARRDGIEICRLRDPRMAGELGCAAHQALWGRRYQFVIPGEASASIFEVFSPSLSN